MRILTGILVPSFEIAHSRTTFGVVELHFHSPASAVFSSLPGTRRVQVPGGRRDEALHADQQVAVVQRFADETLEIGSVGTLPSGLAVQVEDAQLRGTARHVIDEHAIARGRNDSIVSSPWGTTSAAAARSGSDSGSATILPRGASASDSA
jgi:hypothetical protein